MVPKELYWQGMNEGLDQSRLHQLRERASILLKEIEFFDKTFSGQVSRMPESLASEEGKIWRDKVRSQLTANLRPRLKSIKDEMEQLSSTDKALIDDEYTKIFEMERYVEVFLNLLESSNGAEGDGR